MMMEEEMEEMSRVLYRSCIDVYLYESQRFYLHYRPTITKIRILVSVLRTLGRLIGFFSSKID